MNILQQLRQSISILSAKRPSETVLLAIFLLNIVFFLVATLVIYFLSPVDIQNQGLAATLFYTISMVLDAGCISYIVADANQAGAILVVFCLLVVLVGMVFFTGSIIGYVTNVISSFVEKADKGNHPLVIRNHTVILGWSPRACGIITNAAFEEDKQVMVVLSERETDEVEEEIESLLDSVIEEDIRSSEEKNIEPTAKRSNVLYVVRQGDMCSPVQLRNICIDKAKTVYLMNPDEDNQEEGSSEEGDARLIKTLVQVADMTNAGDSADTQRVVAEVEDRWTNKIAKQIVAQKRKAGKSDMVVVSSYSLLGALIAQFAVCPELNVVYDELFSSQGDHFVTKKTAFTADKEGENAFIETVLTKNHKSLPLAVINTEYGTREYYLAKSSKNTEDRSGKACKKVECKINPRSGMEQRKIIVVGSNRHTYSIMEALSAFQREWEKLTDHNPLDVTVIDDAQSLANLNHYRNYKFVSSIISAGLYEDKVFEQELYNLLFNNDTKTTLLVLSEEFTRSDEADAGSIARLVFIQNVLKRLSVTVANFDRSLIDLLVEVRDTKSVEVINSFDVDSTIVSNRYISTLMSQVGEHESLLSLYTQILTYDGGLIDGDGTQEIYMKKASTFFSELPERCSVASLIYSVYQTSRDLKGISPTMLLGYYRQGEGLRLFTDDQTKAFVQLKPDDKLVLFADH